MLVHVELTPEFVIQALHTGLQAHLNVLFPETPIKAAVTFEGDKVCIRTMLDFEATELGTLNGTRLNKEQTNEQEPEVKVVKECPKDKDI